MTDAVGEIFLNSLLAPSILGSAWDWPREALPPVDKLHLWRQSLRAGSAGGAWEPGGVDFILVIAP